MLGSHKTNEDLQRDVFLGRQLETIAGVMSGYGFTAAVNSISWRFEGTMLSKSVHSKNLNRLRLATRVS